MTANPPVVPLWTYAPNPWSWVEGNNRYDLDAYRIVDLSLAENFGLDYAWEMEVAYDEDGDGWAFPVYVDGHEVDEDWACSSLNGEIVTYWTLVDLLTERRRGRSTFAQMERHIGLAERLERDRAWQRFEEVAA